MLSALMGPPAVWSIDWWGWIFWVALLKPIGSVPRYWNRKVSAGLHTVKALSGFI